MTTGRVLNLKGPGVTTRLWLGTAPCSREWPGPDSVIVVPRQGRDLLMVFNRRRDGWEFPGGKIACGELAEQAARREATEEAGVILSELKIICWYEVARETGLERPLSRGVVYVGDILQMGDRTDMDEVADVRAFSAAPGCISFQDGFIQFVFDMERGARA